MSLTILLLSLSTGVTFHEGRGQNMPAFYHQNGPADTARAVPASANLRDDSLQVEDARLFDSWAGPGDAGWGAWFGPRTNQALYLFTSRGNACVIMHPSGRIHLANSLAVNGTTTTKILTVTGGADIAEPFSVSEKDPIAAGAVMVIDEENPGQLKLCRKAYDTRVAGVVSGAGGVKPGLTLQNEGLLAQGLQIALGGRAYALATAANSAIKPGDLLTTSEVAGHAMKATDRALSGGAIIGKALTTLASGEGLVLVLVNLQ